jgi:hypothetical protein
MKDSYLDPLSIQMFYIAQIKLRLPPLVIEYLIMIGDLPPSYLRIVL